MVRLAYDLGLRRKEIVGLDVADVDLQAGAAAVLGKGRRQKEQLILPVPTRAALAACLAAVRAVAKRLAELRATMPRLDASAAGAEGDGLARAARDERAASDQHRHPGRGGRTRARAQEKTPCCSGQGARRVPSARRPGRHPTIAHGDGHSWARWLNSESGSGLSKPKPTMNALGTI
jgi:integrase